ncbi:MAG: CD225/dispanin family protein [Pirellulaceae bacterium]
MSSQNPFGDQFSQQPGQYPYQPSNYGNFGQPPQQYYPSGTVKNYLIESILALICCGGILAIPAIIFAIQVDGKLSQGDYHGAVQASHNAKLWLTIAVCIGVICNLGGCLIGILGAAADGAR